MKLVSIIFQLIIQSVASAVAVFLYRPAVDMMASGIGKLASLFVYAPLLVIALVISAGTTISLLINSLIKIKRYWWLFLLEVASVAGHIYIITKLISAFKG